MTSFNASELCAAARKLGFFEASFGGVENVRVKDEIRAICGNLLELMGELLDLFILQRVRASYLRHLDHIHKRCRGRFHIHAEILAR